MSSSSKDEAVRKRPRFRAARQAIDTPTTPRTPARTPGSTPTPSPARTPGNTPTPTPVRTPGDSPTPTPTPTSTPTSPTPPCKNECDSALDVAKSHGKNDELCQGQFPELYRTCQTCVADWADTTPEEASDFLNPNIKQYYDYCEQPKEPKSNVALIAGITVPVVVLSIAIVVGIIFFRKRQKKKAAAAAAAAAAATENTDPSDDHGKAQLHTDCIPRPQELDGRDPTAAEIHDEKIGMNQPRPEEVGENAIHELPSPRTDYHQPGHQPGHQPRTELSANQTTAYEMPTQREPITGIEMPVNEGTAHELPTRGQDQRT